MGVHRKTEVKPMAAAAAIIPSSAPALRAARSYHMKIIELIDLALQAVELYDPTANAPDPSEFEGLDIAVALRKYLSRVNGRITVQEAVSALQARGCDLGARPLANLQTAVTRNASLFERRGDRIMLRSWQDRAA